MASPKSGSLRTVVLISCVAVLVLVGSVTLWHGRAMPHAVHPPAPTPTVQPLPTISPTYHGLGAPHPVGADFAAYYQSNHGATWLGQALSPELPTPNGETQVYVGGILTCDLSGKQIAPVAGASALMTKGADIPIVDATTTITYIALRDASLPTQQVMAPWWWDAAKDPTVVGIFVAQATRKDVAYGHYIPATFVPFLQGLGDWQRLVGNPTTEVLTDTRVTNAGQHHIIVQGFTNAVLWYDHDATGTPRIQLQPIGEDYLGVFGMPSLAPHANRAAWTLSSPLTIASSPTANDAIATLLAPFALQTASDARWVGHDLWLHLRWHNFLAVRDGWVNADQIAYQAPAQPAAQLADLDALSPQLMADVGAYGNAVTMAIYDPSSGHYYVDNPDVGLEMASMFKVPIIVTLLHAVEQEGRGLTDYEQAEAAAMIEVSDNVAEAALYDEAGGYDGVTRYMNAIGINDIWINTGGIGSTLLSPLSSVRLLDDLRTCRILTAQDCQYILKLMANVAGYQQFGIGDTAPAGAMWSMKVGYGLGLGGNLADSMGIVTYQGHSYILAIYTRFNASVPDGAALVDRLCGEAVAALLGHG